VVVEAESSKVGELMVPPVLWRAMDAAPRVALSAPADARARYLARTYAAQGQDPEGLIALLARLPDRPGRKRLAAWTELARVRELEALAQDLIEVHYDPTYRRSGHQRAGAVVGETTLARLDAEAFDEAAREIARLVAGA